MYYAVRKGHKPGIYKSWDECKKMVMGYSGAIYKKFKTEEEALAFMGQDRSSEDIKDDAKDLKENEIIAYVDGSYNKKDKSFSYGVLLFDNNGIYETNSKRFWGEDSEMRNVAGEIRGSQYAMQRALELGKSKLYIHYDYMGIENWALGSWKANKKGTKAYAEYYSSIKDKLDVVFIKVKAHTGVKYNELVDKLAKEAR